MNRETEQHKECVMFREDYSQADRKECHVWNCQMISVLSNNCLVARPGVVGRAGSY